MCSGAIAAKRLGGTYDPKILAQAGLTNLMYRNSRIGDLRIRSELRAGPLAWLYVTSGVAVVLSLGLLAPWARVRIMRYRASALALLAPSGLDAFVQGAEDNVQIHGGVGFTWEYDAHLYLRRALASRELLGDGAYHRERIAQRLPG